jgi:hypothetical protein
MPHVLEDHDVLEDDLVLSPTSDELHALPLGLPTAPRERSRLLTLLRRLITPVTRLRTRRVAGTPQVETALDVLAREQPDIYLLVMSGIG